MSTIPTNDEAAETGFFGCPGAFRAELAVREQNGVVVTLFWLRGTDVLVVSVVDRRHGDGGFELVLQPDEPALDVFHHPYAYAAARGLDTDRFESEGELVDV
jgi:hypothetical protein